MSDQYGMPTNDDRVLAIGDGNVRIQFRVRIKRYTFLVIRERGWNHVCSLSDQDSQRGRSLLPDQMQWEQDPHNFVLVLLQSRVELIYKERCIQLYRLTYTRSGRLGLTTSKVSILEYWGAGARVSSGCWHSSQHNTKTKLAID